MINDEQIKAIAEKIAKLNLATPSAFLLEAHLPLCGMLHVLSLGVSPIFSTFKGYQNFSNFFSERSNVEKLIEALRK